MPIPGENVGNGRKPHSAGESVNWYDQLEINLATLYKARDAQTLFLPRWSP